MLSKKYYIAFYMLDPYFWLNDNLIYTAFVDAT